MGRPKIYKLNDDYFNGNMTKNMSYLLGLIASDGNISLKRGTFSYSCKTIDIELLYFIQEEFSSTHPIKSFPKSNVNLNQTPYVRYVLTSKKLIKPLVDRFKFPSENKSQNNLVIPTKINAQMMPHFLRGVFDGDGSVWKSKNNDWIVSFTGGENFLLQVQDILLKNTMVLLPLRYRHSKDNLNSCQIEVKGCMQVDKIYEYLYKNSKFALKRKKRKLDECRTFANRYKEKTFKYNGSEKLIIEMYKKGIKQSEISKKLNLVPSSVRACVQRARKRNVVF